MHHEAEWSFENQLLAKGFGPGQPGQTAQADLGQYFMRALSPLFTKNSSFIRGSTHITCNRKFDMHCSSYRQNSSNPLLRSCSPLIMQCYCLID